jgi:hypothetical protein
MVDWSIRTEPWDWPKEPRRGRRFERVEILPPEQPGSNTASIDAVSHVHHRPVTIQRLVMFGALFVLALILIRSGPVAILMFTALVGFKTIAAAAIAVLVFALIAWKEHRKGLPF